MTIILAVTADEHVGCTAGLCVRPVQMDDGGTWWPSKTQRAIAAAWKQFWDAVEARAGALDAAVWWANVGDMIDLNRHDALAPVSQNVATLMDLALATYERPAGLAERRFVVRGTEAHTGPHGELEEMLARQLEAEVCPETGAHSWYHLLLECEGVLFDMAHHPRGGGRLPWTRNATASRISAELRALYLEQGARVPDIAVRAHLHAAADSGIVAKPRAFILDGWQALTPHAYRAGWSVPGAVGGMWFECGQGKVQETRWSRRLRLPSVWRAN